MKKKFSLLYIVFHICALSLVPWLTASTAFAAANQSDQDIPPPATTLGPSTLPPPTLTAPTLGASTSGATPTPPPAGTNHPPITHTQTTLGPASGMDIYNSVAPSVAPVPTASPNTGSSVQEKELAPSPLPPKTATPEPTLVPSAPTAAEIEEARKQEALRKEQEAQRQREMAEAQERLRQEQSFLEATRAYANDDFKKAIGLWSALAKEGHAGSMTAMGLMYDRGEGVLLNSKEAVMWFRLAAEGDDKDGMYHLGRMLAQGRGGTQHVATAATWLQKAADLGQHDAQYLLAVLYERGEGVVQNDSTAAAWYSLAAAGHNVEAQARLGHLYRVGKGVPRTPSRATLLLYGATMAGHKGAQEELFAMSKETFGDKGFPKVTLFGADFAGEQGLTRAQMRSALSVSKVKALREDINFICDVYDLTNSVPGAHQMAVCYGASPKGPVSAKGEPNMPSTPQARQEMGFLKIDYKASTPDHAKAVQNMVESRFGKPSAGEQGQGYLWNLGHVIVATQYVPQKNEVGLMYMIPRVYHTTQSPAESK